MFIDERPIERAEDDRLGRANFSTNLARSILEWKGIGSLVIALNGKWGIGKSSIINLAKNELSKFIEKDQPTIIEFNPWFFSGDENLNEHFFNEISKALVIKNKSIDDKKIANKLREYSSALNIIPGHSKLHETIKSTLVFMAIFGIAARQLINFQTRVSNVIVIGSIILLILSLVNSVLHKISEFLELRAIANTKTVVEFKREIKEFLLKRKSKILIIIDDIDRLTPDEIRTLFKLIKINNDFPNVIYVLSFDGEVVKTALETQRGINGKDYLEKIVQVTFDIPLVKQEKISQILIEECNVILNKLPKSSEFLYNDMYWNTIYKSGLRDLFRNLRDVKRFASSLEFNFIFLFKEDSMEVNPVDFVAIEALRVFAPDFYSFLRDKKSLFTTSKDETSNIATSRKSEIEHAFHRLDGDLQKNVRGLIYRLFPQVGELFASNRNLFSSPYSARDASKLLKVCSPDFFDSYFTFTPGGDAELSQFEIDFFLSTIVDKSNLQKEIISLIERKKLSQVLERIENYTSDHVKIGEDSIANIVQVYFDMSDVLPRESSGFFGRSIFIHFERVILQLFERIENRQTIFDMLNAAILLSKGLYAPILLIDVLSSKNGYLNGNSFVDADKMRILQQTCLKRIKLDLNDKKFILNPDFAFILFKWKKWSSTDDSDIFFQDTVKTDRGLLGILKAFVTVTNIYSVKGTKKEYSFSYDSLDQFVVSEDVKLRLEVIRSGNAELYLENKELIDMFIDNFRMDNRQM